MKMWRERIAEARERGGFTEAEHDDAAGHGWFTCAVGEQHALMPEYVVILGDLSSMTHRPVDGRLYRMGLKFGLAVGGGRFDEADRLLDAIEDRALELKRLGGETRGAP